MTDEQLEAIITRDRDVSVYWFKPNGFGPAEAVTAAAMKDRRALITEVKRLRQLLAGKKQEGLC